MRLQAGWMGVDEMRDGHGRRHTQKGGEGDSPLHSLPWLCVDMVLIPVEALQVR